MTDRNPTLSRTVLTATLAILAQTDCHPAPPPGLPSGEETRVQIIHFSDYHAHAIPFYSEHRPIRGDWRERWPTLRPHDG